MSSWPPYRYCILLVLLVPACGDHPLELQEARYAKLPLSPATSFTTDNGREIDVRNLPALDVDIVAGSDRPWKNDVDLLEELLAESNGLGTIVLKAAGTDRLRVTGRREAMTAADVIAALSEIEELGAEIRNYLPSMGFVRAILPPNAATALLRSPFIDHIAPPEPLEIVPFDTYDTNEPYSAEPRSTQNSFPLNHIGVDPAAWQITTGDTARIMVVDWGYDRHHPDLPVLPDSNCPTWDPVEEGLDFGPGCYSVGSVPHHGTQMLSAIAAIDNDIGGVGVAHGTPASNLFSWLVQDGAENWVFYEGIQFAIDAGVDIINMSWGYKSGDTTPPDEWATIVSSAHQAGILMVAAVGNDNEEKCHFSRGFPTYSHDHSPPPP